MTLRDTDQEISLEREQLPTAKPKPRAPRTPRWRCERCDEVSVRRDDLCQPVRCA